MGIGLIGKKPPSESNIPLDADREDDILEGSGFFVDRWLTSISARLVSGDVKFQKVMLLIGDG